MSGTIRPVLTGQKALVVGVANDQSIAYGCAKAFATVGADLAITWLNDRARPYVEPLARELGASITAPLDVSVPGQLEAVFDTIKAQWGKLDILVHSIAFAPKDDLQGGLLNCSADGFAKAMDISCHSFVRMAKLAAPLMTDGGVDVRHELLRRQPRGAELQRDGPGEGSTGSVVPLSRLRTGAAADPRARDLAGAAEDPGRVRTEGFRVAAERGRGESADRRTRRHHGRRFHLRLPGDAVRISDHRRNGLC